MGSEHELRRRFDELVAKVEAYHPNPDLEMFRNAYALAEEMHLGQARKSGEPYLIHPLAVTHILADLKLDIASLCAGLLHDVVEDTDTTLDDLRERFSDEVAQLVDGVTKLSKLRFNTREERQAESFRKMLIAMSRDLRVILIKLCDRVHNMRTLEHMPENRRVAIAQETMDIYAPLANRLGISWIKVELEDLAFRHLHPEDYEELLDQISSGEGKREQYIGEVIEVLERALKTHASMDGFELQGRVKHMFSIYRKMTRSNIEFDQVYDILAFRIIADTVAQCYEALGIVHNLWKPIPGRFKDYIAIPKPNLYQSLHTSVLGPYRERIEIQIRTHEMHRVAEEGIAAHWMYKEGKITPGVDEQRFQWLRQLMESHQDLEDPREFIDSVKIDLFADEVYVFTPKGEVKSFAKGSTPVDFAYSVHTEVGQHCAGAKVNGQLVPLKYQLRNGDIVEIVTSASQRPKQDWLQFVVSSRARTKIRQFVRKEQRQRSREIGKQLLEKQFRRHNLNLVKLEKSGELEEAARQSRCSSLEELYVNVGLGKVMPETVIGKLLPEVEEKKAEPEQVVEDEGRIARLLQRIRRKPKTGICVDGVDDIMVRFAKCCAPVPGENIVGFVTRGRGVTVHSRSCPKIDLLEPERQIDVHWNATAGKAGNERAVNIRVVCADRPGLLANISQSITMSGVNISQAHCRTLDNRKAINTFELLVRDLKQLRSAIKSISKIPGVYSVERVRT